MAANAIQTSIERNWRTKGSRLLTTGSMIIQIVIVGDPSVVRSDCSALGYKMLLGGVMGSRIFVRPWCFPRPLVVLRSVNARLGNRRVHLV
ncbi:hypothetical protein Pan14r_26310 [Crateriforma conspicua]|uniref:Uncharacterized protein n=1 Tax=Crateriforma conspicua TaxID=2527996 RepID=A0A5C5Y3I4_9PLAN|nr:hypothetical protein Pan14r_26310 [Crateriforma conspicua]